MEPSGGSWGGGAWGLLFTALGVINAGEHCGSDAPFLDDVNSMPSSLAKGAS